MRAFIVLCLVAVACADKLGYNYQPVGHSDSGLSFAPGSGVSGGEALASGPIEVISAGGSGGLGGFGGSSGGSSGLGGLGGSSGLGGLGGSSGLGGGAGESSNVAPSYSADGGLEKEFYTFSANDEEFEEPAASEQLSSSLKQNLRVIFIKGPENNGLRNAAINLAKSASEQQTAIYVLTKQADVGDIANKFNAIRNDNNQKPEVHFVKYRTHEDAANAQRAIQSQYDSLGSNSQSHDGGVAPVINFASPSTTVSHSVGGNGGHGSSAGLGGLGSGISFEGTAPSASYLPASIFRRLRI